MLRFWLLAILFLAVAASAHAAGSPATVDHCGANIASIRWAST